MLIPLLPLGMKTLEVNLCVREEYVGRHATLLFTSCQSYTLLALLLTYLKSIKNMYHDHDSLKVADIVHYYSQSMQAETEL